MPPGYVPFERVYPSAQPTRDSHLERPLERPRPRRGAGPTLRTSASRRHRRNGGSKLSSGESMINFTLFRASTAISISPATAASPKASPIIRASAAASSAIADARSAAVASASARAADQATFGLFTLKFFFKDFLKDFLTGFPMSVLSKPSACSRFRRVKPSNDIGLKK